MDWKNLKAKIERYLVPAGEGIFTVSTAKEKKKSIQTKLYGETENVSREWKNSLTSLPLASDVIILGIPSDTGGGILRGTNWGPLAVREQLFQERTDLGAFDIGDVRTIPHFLSDELLNQKTIEKCREALYQEQIPLPVSPLSIAEDFASSFHQVFPGKKIFTIGGDHSVSYPMVKAYLEHKKKKGIKTAVIHFDAHTDLLPHRLGVDVCFGSWAYHILPLLNSPAHLIQLGIRASGKTKAHWEETLGVTQYWSEEIIQNGPGVIADKIIADLKKDNIEELYVTFDIDALDAQYAGSTGTPETGGLSPHEVMTILHHLHENFPITGSDLTEVAPNLHHPELKDFKSLEPLTTLMMASAVATFLIQAMGISHRTR